MGQQRHGVTQVARVLILRPEAEAAETAAAIIALGHEALLLPLHEIVPLDRPPPGGEVCGFIATSAHALPALAEAFPRDDRPLLAVGPRTARLAAELGFAEVVAGEGTGESLLHRAAQLFAASGRPLLYAAGRVRTPALEEAAARSSVSVVPWEVYDTRPLSIDLLQVAARLAHERPQAVLILSVGQAEAYGSVANGLQVPFRAEPRLLCLSRRIAQSLPPDLWPRAEISEGKSLAALFDLLRSPS